jgi:predicted nucleic acid-binding protein
MAKRAFKVFLDSNMILSGLLSERGAPRIILDLLSLRLPFLIGSTGRYDLIEIERNLKKKMPGLLFLYKTYLPKLNLKVIPLPRPFPISAIRSKADFLVTGDKQHFEKMKGLDKYPFDVVAPSEFIDSILPEILKELEEKG